MASIEYFLSEDEDLIKLGRAEPRDTLANELARRLDLAVTENRALQQTVRRNASEVDRITEEIAEIRGLLGMR